MKRNDDNSRIPENDLSKAMDSKKEVEQSNDARTDQDFPGYPHYPAKEDIMSQDSGFHKVDMNVEEIASGRNATGVNQRFTENRQKIEEPRQPNLEDVNKWRAPEQNVTEDELRVLNSTNDEIGVPQNVDDDELNSDLDIPGSELDDENERIGEEDEENNYYSLGGDRQEANEEDPYSGPDRGNEG